MSAAQIPLSNSPLFALVDEEDLERVTGLKWKLHPEGYVMAQLWVEHKRFDVFLHHAIIGFPIPTTPRLLTDHRDRDPLNNQKANLRHCSYRQNNQNSSTRRAGLKGVYFNRRSKANPWVGQIVVNGRKVWLGSFPSEQLAHSAYCAAAAHHFGQFAAFA